MFFQLDEAESWNSKRGDCTRLAVFWLMFV
jgi:hypothetical protein